MKLHFLIICLPVLFFTSCSETKQGITSVVSYVSVNAKDSTSITDTLMKVVRYPNNGTFQNPIDSISQSYHYYSSPVNKLLLRIDTSHIANYNFDLVCSLYPSGKIYKITGLTHTQTSCKQDLICKKLAMCYNDIHYFVNGKQAVATGIYGILDIEY
jgi:hypothetical protein